MNKTALSVAFGLFLSLLALAATPADSEACGHCVPNVIGHEFTLDADVSHQCFGIPPHGNGCHRGSEIDDCSVHYDCPNDEDAEAFLSAIRSGDSDAAERILRSMDTGQLTLVPSRQLLLISGCDGAYVGGVSLALHDLPEMLEGVSGYTTVAD